MAEEKTPELSEEELGQLQERLRDLQGSDEDHERIETEVDRLTELSESERNKEIETRLQNLDLEKKGGKSRHKRSKRSRKTKRIRTKRSRKTKRNRTKRNRH